MIIKNYITNKENCNYEIYMRELINSSLFFLEKSNHEIYKEPKSEERHQSDCESAYYDLDFKLLLPETAGIAIREFSFSIVQFSEGFYGYGSSRITLGDEKYKPIETTLFHSVLRKMKYDELLKYEKVNVRKKSLSRDVNLLLKDMRTPKNLLCLIPYRFFFEGRINHKDGLAIIMNAVTEDYDVLFDYRSRKFDDLYETYISFIYDNNLCILGLNDGKIIMCDEILLSISKTYTDLSSYTGL